MMTPIKGFIMMTPIKGGQFDSLIAFIMITPINQRWTSCTKNADNSPLLLAEACETQALMGEKDEKDNSVEPPYSLVFTSEGGAR